MHKLEPLLTKTANFEMKQHMKWFLPVGESTDKDRGIGTAKLNQPSVALLPQIKGFPTKPSSWIESIITTITRLRAKTNKVRLKKWYDAYLKVLIVNLGKALLRLLLKDKSYTNSMIKIQNNKSVAKYSYHLCL